MKLNKHIFLFLIFNLLFFLNCNKNTQNKNSNTIIDDIGNELKIETPPQRIISLAPNITETIYALGADSLLIGITDYCNYPKECKSKQTVGGMINPNIEIISLLKPDLILFTVEGNSKSTYNTLINNGYKVFVTNPRDINGIMKMISDIGFITNLHTEAKEINKKIDSVRIILDSLNKTNPKAKALFILSINPIITINKSTYINDILELAGYENIYAELELPYPQISYEDIILKNPEYIILTSELADSSENYKNLLSKNLSTTTAIKENKIIIIEADIISRPGPRIIQALAELKNKKGK